MKLTRTKNYSFGWLCVFPALDVLFLLIFFSPAQFELYSATRHRGRRAVLALHPRTAGKSANHQHYRRAQTLRFISAIKK